jgi:hypothetical protein
VTAVGTPQRPDTRQQRQEQNRAAILLQQAVRRRQAQRQYQVLQQQQQRRDVVATPTTPWYSPASLVASGASAVGSVVTSAAKTITQQPPDPRTARGRRLESHTPQLPPQEIDATERRRRALAAAETRRQQQQQQFNRPSPVTQNRRHLGTVAQANPRYSETTSTPETTVTQRQLAVARPELNVDADSDDDFASAAGDDDFDLDPRELVSDPGFQSAVEGLRSLVPREQTESPATVNTQRGDRPSLIQAAVESQQQAELARRANAEVMQTLSRSRIPVRRGRSAAPVNLPPEQDFNPAPGAEAAAVADARRRANPIISSPDRGDF